MKRLTLLGGLYMVFGLGTCGFFCAAAMGGWAGPNFSSYSGGSSFMSGSSYGGGSSYGRSSGGSWGGGK